MSVIDRLCYRFCPLTWFMVKENSPQEEEQLIPGVTVTGQSRLVKWKEQLGQCSSRRSPEQHGREKERKRGDDADA